MGGRIRVLVGKVGLDGHDRGVKVIARALRDAGMEVIYSGLFQSPQSIAAMAVQEDVDVIGISILSGAHMTLLPRVREALRRQGADDIAVIAGGVIPPGDAAALKARGVVEEVFTPGQSLDEITGWIRQRAGVGRP